jgi:hypothetical protein
MGMLAGPASVSRDLQRELTGQGDLSPIGVLFARQVRRHMSDMSFVLVKRVAEKEEEEKGKQQLPFMALARLTSC